MGVLFDHGVWQTGAPYGVGTDGQTRASLVTLVNRGLARLHADRFCLTEAGYAWMICEAAADLRMVSFGSVGADMAIQRITHLAQCARLVGAQGGPVDWRGNPV